MGILGLAYELFNEWCDNLPCNKTEVKFDRVSKDIVVVNSYKVKTSNPVGEIVHLAVFDKDSVKRLKNSYK